MPCEPAWVRGGEFELADFECIVQSLCVLAAGSQQLCSQVAAECGCDGLVAYAKHC